jgi:crotonobetainyl-CoA:carnitine CoA-transferase CaiB-like acyl-CoA transferase
MGVAAGHRAYQLGWKESLEHRRSIGFDEGMEELASIRVRNGGPTNNADAASALVVGTGMVLGLLARRRTGEGQYMETTMLCSNAYVVSDQFFDYEGAGPVATHDEDGAGPLYRLYQAREGWVFLAAPLPADWDRLAAVLDAAGPTGSVALGGDARFSSPAARDAHAAELAAQLGEIFATRPAAAWEELLASQHVACVEVSQRPLSEFTINDPSMVENGFTAEVEHPLFGRHRRHGPIVSLSDTPGTAGPGCLIGQHTRTILAELGYSDEEMEALRRDGVVAWPDGAPSRAPA